MPLFEYTCRDCGHSFETLVTGARQPDCPKCGSAALEKLYSTFGTRTAGAGGESARPATPPFT